MKRRLFLILLAFTALMMAGCDKLPNKTRQEKIDEKYAERTFIVDSCEYISFWKSSTHKGNCRFCKERRQNELEKLVEALCDEKITSSTSYSTMNRVMHELKDWLKSLKDRVQPKQEWSTEDNVHLTNAILAAEKEWGAESYTVKWLKSLNPKRNF